MLRHVRVYVKIHSSGTQKLKNNLNMFLTNPECQSEMVLHRVAYVAIFLLLKTYFESLSH